MSRIPLVLSVAALVVAALAVGRAAQAANPVKQCPKTTGAPWQFPGTSMKGSTYGSYVVGTFTCGDAARWLKKLSPTVVENRKLGAHNVLTNGPKGYVCTANPDANGHAFAGSCRKGKGSATVGFGWGGRP